MKGIYLSEEGKKEIEAKIAELEKHIENVIKIADIASDKTYGISKTYLEIEFRTKQNTLKEILASAIVLPIESNMSYVKSYDFVDEFDVEYPQGVIIQPKQ
jgi:hypothetical protein